MAYSYFSSLGYGMAKGAVVRGRVQNHAADRCKKTNWLGNKAESGLNVTSRLLGIVSNQDKKGAEQER